MKVLASLIALAAPVATATTRSSQPAPIAIKVDRIVAADGSIGPGGWIVIRGGKIESIAAATPPPGAQTLEFAGGVAAPGFVDAVTSLGSEGDLEEPARAFTPQVQASDSFHPDHSDFRKAARAGVTTVGVSPASSNVVGGHVAIVRTFGEQGLAVFEGAGPMRLALSGSAFDRRRSPTSRIGALPMLREMAKEGKLAGTGASIVEAASPDEIRLAIETVGGTGESRRAVALLQPLRADDALDVVKGSGALALLGPFDLDTPDRDLRLPQVLNGAGVPVAFTAGGSAAALRLTAALAVRAGLDPKLALQALTVVPARVLGVEEECGTLAPGRRADLVVFRGDPLDLGSKVELVLVGGAVVPVAEPTVPAIKEKP
jgi:imidazolonepropionase-like amidohydrolase